MNNEIKKHDGLIPAPVTPMTPDREIDHGRIENLVETFVENDIVGAFICGTTGEFPSLTIEERKSIAETWDRCRPDSFSLFVHVGHENTKRAKELATHADRLEVDAVSISSPSFLTPPTLEDLVRHCSDVAQSASSTPFYYYHIPEVTGAGYRMYDFIQLAENRIPTFSGIKFTDYDLFDFGLCLEHGQRKYDLLFGRDEILLSALQSGARGAVGSFYNFAAPLFNEIMECYENRELTRANELQSLARTFTLLFQEHGTSAAPTTKAILKMAGMDCGPVRPPFLPITGEQFDSLETELKDLGFDRYFMKGI